MVSSFEELWLLFPEVAVTSAPQVMTQSTSTFGYSFSCAMSFERASTLSFISWFCYFSEEIVSFGIISVKIINKRTVEKRLIKVRSVGLKFNVHLGSWLLNHPFINFILQAQYILASDRPLFLYIQRRVASQFNLIAVLEWVKYEFKPKLILRRNQRSEGTCEQDVTPDQRRKVSYLVVVWTLSVSFQSFVLCHLVIAHVGNSPRN